MIQHTSQGKVPEHETGYWRLVNKGSLGYRMAHGGGYIQATLPELPAGHGELVQDVALVIKAEKACNRRRIQLTRSAVREWTGQGINA